VIKNAKQAVLAHTTILKKDLEERDVSHFVTEHRFPEDPSKTVTIHHLLFNLFLNENC